MFSRNSQPSSSSHTAPDVEFRTDVVDLFAENLVSAQRVSKLLNKASKAGITNISSKVQQTKGKNQARSLTRFKLKRTKWPDYFWFQCRVWDRKAKKEMLSWIPVHLPSEILEVILQLGNKDVILSEARLDTDGRKHLQWMREQLGVSELWGWGIHGDGIPCNDDRTESTIMLSIN